MSTCPICKKTLAVISYEEKDLLQCLDCQGFWFTNGQFREVKQIGFSGLCANEHPEPAPRNDPDNTPELTCPDCSDQILVAYNYAYSSDIQLHRCTACKGIWAEQQALSDIEALLANYQESLEEAKAKALPLMMEVKKKFTEEEEAREIKRNMKKKQGLFDKLFRKNTQKERKAVDIFADIRANADSYAGEDSHTETEVYADNSQEHEE